jgi:hypothetical protein
LSFNVGYFFPIVGFAPTLVNVNDLATSTFYFLSLVFAFHFISTKFNLLLSKQKSRRAVLLQFLVALLCLLPVALALGAYLSSNQLDLYSSLSRSALLASLFISYLIVRDVDWEEVEAYDYWSLFEYRAIPISLGLPAIVAGCFGIHQFYSDVKSAFPLEIKLSATATPVVLLYLSER